MESAFQLTFYFLWEALLHCVHNLALFRSDDRRYFYSISPAFIQQKNWTLLDLLNTSTHRDTIHSYRSQRFLFRFFHRNFLQFIVRLPKSHCWKRVGEPVLHSCNIFHCSQTPPTLGALQAFQSNLYTLVLICWFGGVGGVMWSKDVSSQDPRMVAKVRWSLAALRPTPSGKWQEHQWHCTGPKWLR